MKKILRNSPVSISDQLKEILRDEIINRFKKDDKFYSERQIAKKFHVALVTIERAIFDLVRDGLLYTKRCRGTFVGEIVKQQTNSYKIQQENIYFPFLSTSRKQIILKVVFGDIESAQRKITEKIIEKFQQNNSDIIIDPIYDENIILNSSLAKKSQCDIIQVAEPQIFLRIDPEDLLDLSLFAKKDSINFNDFLPFAREKCFVNGKLLGLPFSLTLFLIFVNKDLIEQSKIYLPEKFNSWDEHFEICAKVSESLHSKFPGREIYGTIFYDFFYYFLPTKEAKNFFNNNSKLHFGELVKPLLKIFIKFKDKAFPVSNILELSLNKMNLFYEGKTVLFCGFTCDIPSIRENAKFEWEIRSMPFYKGGHSDLALMMSSILSNSNYPEESWRFIKFLNSKEAQSIYAKGWKNVPVLKEVVFSSDYLGSFNKIIRESLENSDYFNFDNTKRYSHYSVLIAREVESLLEGKTTLEKTIQALNNFGKYLVKSR